MADQRTAADFKTELTDKLQRLVTLDVLTVVTPSQTVDPNRPATGPYLLTRIDLLEGDIRFEVTDTLLDEKFNGIRAAHAEREKQALEIIDKHVELVMKVVQKISEFASELKSDKKALGQTV